MPKFEKPLREIIFEYLKMKDIKIGDIFHREEFTEWLNKNYPGFSKGSVLGNLTTMSTNDRSRIHHRVKRGRDDVFYKLSSSEYRLYDSNNDEPPIYKEQDAAEKGVNPQSIPSKARLAELFNQFRQDPVIYFAVKLRRKRAKQIKELLSYPEQIDWEVFQREVWLPESETYLHTGNNKEILKKELFFKFPGLTQEQIGNYEQYLENDQLEFHGNYIWGTGSKVFAPSLKDIDKKNDNIQRALTILNSPQLKPIDKANKIKQIYGFGDNLSTGLVMIYHPDEFALLNAQSKEMLNKLGYSFRGLEEFQENVKQIFNMVDARDYLELDWFFYLFNQGIIGPQLPSKDKARPQEGRSTDEGKETKGRSFNIPLNLILFGPPGTGKTHRLRTEYFNIFTDTKKTKTKEDFALEIASESSWWEAIAMAMIEIKQGPVRKIFDHPLVQAKAKNAITKFPRQAIWAQLQLHTKADCPNVHYARSAEPLIFSKGDNSVWSIDMEIVESELADLKERLATFNNFTEELTEKKRYVFTTFHQSYSYEDFVEGIKPCLIEESSEPVEADISYEIKDGIFKQIVKDARRDPGKPYALFIDEISRGNVASIFGELITLIEDDKRLGAKHELEAVLPYSREKFTVPSNLHIIGTMNTADRSVVALDNALRRRFSFIEIGPEVDKIEQPVGLQVDLKKLFETINARIERLLDKDHVIGHSYLMEVNADDNPLQALQRTFANKILPLLQEYFFGDPAKIGMVLGEQFVKVHDGEVSFATGDWGGDDYEERKIYKLADPLELTEEAFRGIYE